VTAGSPPHAGSVGLFTESPQRGSDALDAATARGLGLSTFLSAGRKADVSVSDALQFWEADDETRVVALALRSLGNPRRSAAIARRVARQKPVLAWLADLPEAPPEGFVCALEDHAGVIRCASLDDLFDVAEALLAKPGARHPHAVAERIRAWERWRRAPLGHAERAERVDPFAARSIVDALLSTSPSGLAPSEDDVAGLLRSYGIDPGEALEGKSARPLVRVAQDPAWGSVVALYPLRGVPSVRLVPLTDRDLHALAAPGSHALRALRLDLLRRVATLAADVPELASLTLAVPTHEDERPSLVRGSARLAPWTLGLLRG
jgi:hypothetical protein